MKPTTYVSPITYTSSMKNGRSKVEGSGDEALMALLDEHTPMLRYIITLDVHNSVDVDDVFQETVLAILRHFRTGTPVKHPKAWAVQIAKSKCIDFHRRHQREINREWDLGPFISSTAFGGGVSLADDQHQAVVAKEIRNQVAEMKPIYRNVGELHIQGYTTREISKFLEISEGTVKSRIRKFRQLIQEYLEMDTPS